MKRNCYAALGIVHSNYRPIPGEFDDYIANPKDNMYRSLHTAVLVKNAVVAPWRFRFARAKCTK